jgi:hypothetical protein
VLLVAAKALRLPARTSGNPSGELKEMSNLASHQVLEHGGFAAVGGDR